MTVVAGSSGLYDDPTDHELVDSAPDPASHDHDDGPLRAMTVLRRGLAASPELREGIGFTVAMALAGAVGKLIVPILIQQVLDKGVLGDEGFRPGFVFGACTVALLIVTGVAVLSRATYIRLVQAAEAMLMGLRLKAFAHIHRLSLADHNESRRGQLTARVTSDIETIARFAQWGAVSWIVDGTMVFGTLFVLAIYAWQFAAIVVVLMIPTALAMRALQRRQLASYDIVRSRVSDTISEFSETIQGAEVIRAYGLRDRSRRRLHSAIDRQYRAEIGAARYFAAIFTVADVFGGLCLAIVIGVGVWWGPAWGLDTGVVIACIFLVQLMLTPVAQIGEILDQTQVAIAGWRKVLDVLDLPVDVPDPESGATIPDGAIEVVVAGVGFSYREGGPVLADVDVTIPAGTTVAVVGETGSGKSTFAKLLCRLADPTEGRVLLDGVDLRELAGTQRRTVVRMVPQDGFLFDTSVRENVRFGRPDATDEDVDEAFASLGLGWWVERLANGLDSEVGERGDSLSVGERQLVALARAQLSDPGLLILDEATSAVDPETERALSDAMAVLSEGRTMVSIAHRLSTAEAADVVLVFDAGRLVEVGPHRELVEAGGVYSRLYASWVGNTRSDGSSTA